MDTNNFRSPRYGEDLLEQFGGRLVKTMGDGTMSVFTSAGRALKAACELQRAVDAIAGEPRLTLRIGMNTGDIMEAGDDFLGTVVNKAARIASVADPGEICVSDATRAMVGTASDYEFESPATVGLKGLDGEHVLHRLKWRMEGR
ncbi:adenylate/guanylate cyclase domain-containing protein [Primorskyibacter sp. S87]|uniref:adenylate/guanylate cyclase domain-containing protein n=1 Tax=Primorskyibacter sp. S87 TaxID=3415126 RepID=UPI003C7E7665